MSSGPIRATNWAKAEEYAKTRPLLSLELIARSPVDAHSLISLAQPFGADSITLSIDVSGELKDGGRTYFRMENIKPTHGLKPFDIAQKLYTATKEDVLYEAILFLGFGQSGRTGLESQFTRLGEEAPEGISLNADFGSLSGGRT